MNAQTFETFMEEAGRDESLAAAIARAVEGRTGLEANQAVADLATGKGYALTAGDVDAGRQRLLDTLDAEPELSDETLETVSGGVDPLTLTLASGAAIVGAAAVAGGAALGLSAVTNPQKTFDNVKSFFSGW